MSLIEQFISHIEKTQIFQKGDHILLGVSGGMDSMVLLDLCIKVKSQFDISISVIHINHHLRSDSAKDEGIVRKACRELCIPFYLEELHPSDMSKSESIEAWARGQRYAKFEEVREKTSADKIATAHHADDQLETVMMHIAEGTGLAGLQGVHGKMGNVIRPLLQFDRKTIQEYAENNQINFIEDLSNSNVSHPRNFLRHHVIPPLKKIYPSLSDQIHRFSENIREYNDVYQFLLNEKAESWIVQEKGGVFVCELKENIPIVMYIHALRNWLDKGAHWRKNDWEQLKYFISKSQTGCILTIGDFQLLKNRKSIIIQNNEPVHSYRYSIKEGNVIENNQFRFLLKKVTNDTSFSGNNSKEIVNENALGKNLEIRQWRRGDFFQPLGMSGHKKVSDFLIDMKMDRFRKQKQYVLANGKEVLWVCGVRISDQIKITNRTKNMAELSFQLNVGLQ